jgi:hypothetical protein
MTKEEKIEEIRQRARKNFSLGYNCAECVTEAVLSLVEHGAAGGGKKVRHGLRRRDRAVRRHLRGACRGRHGPSAQSTEKQPS